MKLKKYNVFYQYDESGKSVDKNKTQINDIDKKREELDKKVPSEGNPGKDSPKERMKTLNEEVKKYKKKINQMEDGKEKTRLKDSLTVVEKFLKDHQNLGDKKLSEMLNSRQPKTEGGEKFRKALNNLSSKFDKKEKKESTNGLNKKETNIIKDLGIDLENVRKETFLVVDKGEFEGTYTDIKILQKKVVSSLGIKDENIDIKDDKIVIKDGKYKGEYVSFQSLKEKVRESSVLKEDLKKLARMDNTEFLKYSPEERLKFITKEHLKPQDVKEGTKITFTFTFDNQYNEELWRKTTAGQVLPTTVNVVKQGDTEYTRRGLKGEFFTKAGKRLIINEGTRIEIGKPLTKEQIEKIENINEMKYKAYMGELKAEAIQDEKLKKEFFDKDGKLLEKYKLDDKQKELFKQNPDIVKESIARNIDPKFAVLVFSNFAKDKKGEDRKVLIEDMFTEFDRKVPGIGNWDGKSMKDGKYPDKLVVELTRLYGGDKWREIAKSYGLTDERIKKIESTTTYKAETVDILNLPKGVKGLLKFIGNTENGRFNYECIYGNEKATQAFEKPLSELTVREVIQRQKAYKDKHNKPSAAIGAYQFMCYTLSDMIRRGKISGNEKFTNEFQDKIATYKLVERGLNSFLAGRISTEQFAHKLSCEWASLPDPYNGGKSHYAKDGLNHSLTSLGNFLAVLNKLKQEETGKSIKFIKPKETSNSSKESQSNNIEVQATDVTKEMMEKIHGKKSISLRFVHGKVDEQLKKLDKSDDLKNRIKEAGNVFLFRKDTDLSISEIKKITSAIKKIDENIIIFIDQEGGKVHRIDDYAGEKGSDKYIKEAFSKLGIENKKLKGIIDKLLTGTHMPSLKKIGDTYRNEIKDEKTKQEFLNAVTYIRLATLKDKGINSYGLVTDLDKGNKIISGADRSFSSDVDEYLKFGKAMLDNADKLSMTVYLKHFPGHGIGVDTHKDVLKYKNTKSYEDYLNENIKLFKDLVEHKKGKVGIMVGHMFIPNSFKDDLEQIINEVPYVITDDLNMEGYKDGIKQEKQEAKKGLFLTTTYLLNHHKDKVTKLTVPAKKASIT